MALVQKQQGVGRQIVGQGGWRRAWRRTRKVAAVVLNAFAVAYLGQHFQVKTRALLQTLGFDQFAHAQQLFQAASQFGFDGFNRGQHLLARRDIVARRVNGKARHLLHHPACERVEQIQRLDLVVKQLHAQRQLRMLGRKDINRVAAHAKLAARELQIIALVLHPHQLGDGFALRDFVARAQDKAHLHIALGRTYAVNRADGGDDDGVAPLQHALGGRQAHLLNLLVDGRVFFNEQIALRHIGLGLVVVVIADEVLDRVIREEFAELAVKLRRQGFIGRKNDGRPARAGNDIGHGVGFARTRHAQQGLKALAVF